MTQEAKATDPEESRHSPTEGTAKGIYNSGGGLCSAMGFYSTKFR